MAFKTQTLVSVGWMRPLSGSVLGVAIAESAAIVVAVVELRFTRLRVRVGSDLNRPALAAALGKGPARQENQQYEAER